MTQKNYLEILKISLTDDKLREGLLADCEKLRQGLPVDCVKTLSDSGYSTSPEDMAKLVGFLKQDFNVDAAAVINTVTSIIRGTAPPPPPPWQFDVDLEELT